MQSYPLSYTCLKSKFQTSSSLKPNRMLTVLEFYLPLPLVLKGKRKTFHKTRDEGPWDMKIRTSLWLTLTDEKWPPSPPPCSSLVSHSPSSNTSAFGSKGENGREKCSWNCVYDYFCISHQMVTPFPLVWSSKTFSAQSHMPNVSQIRLLLGGIIESLQRKAAWI